MHDARPRSSAASRQRSTTPLNSRPSWNFSTKRPTSSGGSQSPMVGRKGSTSPTASRVYTGGNGSRAVGQTHYPQHGAVYQSNMGPQQQGHLFHYPQQGPVYPAHYDNVLNARTYEAPPAQANAVPSLDAIMPNTGSAQQIMLFAQLQDVVVRLSQAARADKGQLSQLTAKLEAYERLVREQDKMIDDLRAMNARLLKEKEALSSFRPGGGSQGVVLDEDEGPSSTGGNIGATPKTRNFMQSLVDQLREEKRHRFDVEEQSSRMIGEQQLTIHRLEERLQKLQNGVVGTPRKLTASPARAQNSPRVGGVRVAAAVATPTRSSSNPTTQMAVEPMEDHMHPSQWREPSSSSPPSQPMFTEEEQQQPRNSINDKNDSREPPAEVGRLDSELTMESAAVLLQRIRERHGL